MELASLLVRVGITGVGEVKRGLSEVEGGLQKTASKAKETGVEFERFEAPLLAAAGAAGSLLYGIREATVMAGTLSGVVQAAKWQKLEIGFTNILGSAKEAKGLLADIKTLGATTEFNTEELTKFARLLLATGSTAKGVVREMKALGDAVAFSGGSTADVEELAKNLSQIRSNGAELEDIKQFGTRGIDLSKVLSAGLGRKVERGQVNSTLKSLPKEQQFEVLISGMEKAFGGSAIKNAGSLLGIIQNLGETFQNIMVPTGQILLPVLGSVAGLLGQVGVAAQKVNEVTGGSAGLILLIYGLYKAKNTLIGSIVGAVAATRNLTSSLMAYSGAAGAASLRGGVASGAAAVAGGGGAIGGLRGKISMAGGILPMLKGAGGALLNGAKGFLKGGGAGVIADIGLNMLGDKVGGTGGGILKGIGTGAGLGGLIGSIVPGIGTAVGTAVGAAIGGIAGYFNSRNAASNSDNADIAKNTKAAADTLKEIKTELIGGGSRANRVKGDLEIEAAFGRILATGIG